MAGNEYNLPIGGDIGELLKAVQTTKTALTGLNEDAKKTGKSIKESFSQASAEGDKLTKTIGASAESYKRAERSLGELTDSLQYYREQSIGEKDVAKLATYNREIDKVTKDIQKLANVGRKGFDDMGNPLKSQAGIIDKLSQRIKVYENAVTGATDPLKIVRFNKKLEELRAQLERTTNVGKKGFDELGNKIEKVEKDISGKFLSGVKQIGLAMGIAFGISEIFSFGKEVVNLTAKAEGVERAFNKINAPGLLENLRKATRGTVSDLNLMMSAVNANNFQIPLEKMGSLLQFAQERARDTGQSVDYLVESIITGIARKSPLILDNLGINIQRINAEFKKTGDFAKSAFLVVEEELKKGGERALQTADKISIIGATWENVKISAGKNTGGIINWVADITGGYLSWLNIAIKDTDQRIGDLAGKYAKEYAPTDQFKADDAIGRAKYLKGLNQQIAEAEAEFTRINADYEGATLLQKSFGTIEGKRDEAKLQVEQLKAELQILNGIVETENKDEKSREQARAEAWEKGKEKREADEKARLQKLKENADRRIALLKELAQAQVDAIADEGKRAQEQEKLNFKFEKEALEREKIERPQLSGLINQLIEQKRASHIFRLGVLITKQAEQEKQASDEARKAIASILKNSLDAEIEGIESRYQEVLTKAKKAGVLTAEVEIAINKQKEKDITDATLKSKNETLNKAQDLLIGRVEIRKKLEGETEKHFELMTQKQILGIKIDYAEKALALIADDPAREAEANKIRKNIQDLKNELKGVNKNIDLGESFSVKGSLSKLLGIDEETFDEILAPYVQLFDAISQAWTDGIQRDIEAGDFRIDALKDQIDRTEEELDRENDLKERGFANNADAKKKEVEELKAQLEKEEADRQENVKRMQDAQKVINAIRSAEMIAQSIEQTVNLTTAATKVFKATSGIPFIGVALAFGAVASMIAGFLAIKSTIKNASSQKFEKGDEIASGKRHSQGGNKYRSIDGNDPRILEIEEGEFIVNRKSTQKHKELIRAINNDDFSGLSLNDFSIKELLKGTGVQESGVAKRTGRETVEKQESASLIIVKNDGSAEIKRLSGTVEEIVKLMKSRPEVLETQEFTIIKRGNTTERIRKDGKNKV